MEKKSSLTIQKIFLTNEGDIRVIVKVNGIKIGIESQGDPNSRLKISLDIFVEYDCDIIICATRTRGTTVDIVNALKEKSYEIEWIAKTDFQGDFVSQNKSFAKSVFDGILNSR